MREAILAMAPLFGVSALVFGPLSAWVAARRQRNPAAWLAFGALLGPVACALLLVSPPAQCPACSEPTRGFERACTSCGLRFGSGERPRTEAPATSFADPPAPILTSPPVLRSVPDLAPPSGTGREAPPAGEPGVAVDALPERLSAIGARRPEPDGTAPAQPHGATRSDVTMLAIGVFVRGSESLVSGSRYLIARTQDRLRIIGPVEPSDDHVELDLPLAGIEANYIPDRLVIGGRSDDGSGRSFVLAFGSVAGMTSTPVDEAIMQRTAPIPIAAGRR